ncbi:MAG: TMEM165/GDT1 family protein [Planctomycetota bacterium]
MTLDPTTLASSFSLIFLAEMGDKTQLMMMALAHRYRPVPVLVGGCSAFLVLNLLGVALGQGLGDLLPTRAVAIGAGLLFLLFAYRTWRDADSEEEDEPEEERGRRGPLVTSFLLILVAELGDKTQLAVVALAAEKPSWLAVFLGGTLALWSVATIGVLLGARLLRRLPPAVVHKSAALLFAIFGLWSLCWGLA